MQRGRYSKVVHLTPSETAHLLRLGSPREANVLSEELILPKTPLQVSIANFALTDWF